ncbi:MAG: T9SS type A sorting domain-containing protein [Bacteroidales bacterium]|nr:T9SS type A sorting domain-containing protein [Bacteroidales bacterium]
MKKNSFLIILFILLGLSNVAQQAKWLYPKTFGGYINDIDFFDDQHALAVGEWGYIAVTHDGGQTWTDVGSPTTGSLGEITWLNASEVIIKSKNLLLYSPDKGQTWSVRFQTSYQIMKICFVDNMVGFALFKDWTTELIYRAKTLDGGQHWDVIPQGGGWRDLCFKNADTGIYIEPQAIYQTTDGGNTLQQIYLGEGNFRACAWADGDTVFIANGAGPTNAILRSTDNGLTWSPVYQKLSDDGFYILKIKNKRNVYASAHSFFLISHDQGNQWTKAEWSSFPPYGTSYPWYNFSVSCIAPDTKELRYVFWKCSGHNYPIGQVAEYDSVAHIVQFDPTNNLIENIFSLDLNGSRMLTGTYNRIHRSEDVGNSWYLSNYYSPGPPFLYQYGSFTELSFSSMNYALAAARVLKESPAGPDEAFSTFFFTPDGGLTWQQSPQDSLPYCMSLAFPSADRAYFLGRRAMVIVKKDLYPSLEMSTYGRARFFRSTNQGSNWTEMPLPLDTLANLVFTGREEGYLFGGGGTTPAAGFYKTLNGGETWEYTALGLPSIQKGQIVNSNLMFLLTADSISAVYRAIKTGSGWDTTMVFKQPTGLTIRDIGFTGENEGYVLCVYESDNFLSTIYYTTDGGEHWTVLGNYPFLNSLRVTYNMNGYAFGMAGRILQLNDGYPVGQNQTIEFNRNSCLFAYPNPFYDNLIITLPKECATELSQINIWDNQGRKVLNLIKQGKQISINVAGLVPGIYMIEIINEKGHWFLKALKI